MYDKKDYIKEIADSKAMTMQEASRFVERERMVQRVRQEAEQHLGRRLPSVLSSAFIEEFCLCAPIIAVETTRAGLIKSSTDDDWRFLQGVICHVNSKYSNPWFHLQTYGLLGIDDFTDSNEFIDLADFTTFAPEKQEPSSESHQVGIHISPGLTLAQFTTLFEGKFKSHEARAALLARDSRAMKSFARLLVQSVNAVPCCVKDLVGGIIHESTTLKDALLMPAVLPPWQPSHKDIDLLGIAQALDDEYPQIGDPEATERSKVHGAHKQELLREVVDNRVFLVRKVTRALGEGRPIVDGVAPEDIFWRFLLSGREMHEESKRRVAIAYFDNKSMPPGDIESFIRNEIAHNDRMLKRSEENDRRRRENYENIGLGNHVKPSRFTAYRRYLKDALETNIDFLVKLFSS
jgi:hypothetical protein